MTQYSATSACQYAAGRRTVSFFTDRSLYRPGQTVHYKGICLRVDVDGGDYHVLERQSLRVTFYDPNGKEIAQQTHRANDYASFNGSFTAPGDRVAGRMRSSFSRASKLKEINDL